MKMDLPDNMQMPAASPEIFQQLGTLTRQLHDTLNVLGVLPDLKHTVDDLPDARSRLTYIATKTADAAEKVLNLVDKAKADQEHIATETRRLAQLIVADPVKVKAAQAQFAAAVGTPDDVWLDTYQVIVMAAAYGCRHAIPAMLERGGGAIVNMSSGVWMGGGNDMAGRRYPTIDRSVASPPVTDADPAQPFVLGGRLRFRVSPVAILGVQQLDHVVAVEIPRDLPIQRVFADAGQRTLIPRPGREDHFDLKDRLRQLHGDLEREGVAPRRVQPGPIAKPRTSRCFSTSAVGASSSRIGKLIPMEPARSGASPRVAR